MITLWRRFLSARHITLNVVLAACAVAATASGGVDSGGTGARQLSYARGPVSGANSGSITVNDIRFDDSATNIIDDEGVTRAAADLKLGMNVDVEGGPVVNDPAAGISTAVAHTVRIGSSIRGPVQAVNLVASTITVFGQTVAFDRSTVFDGLAILVNGVASILVGQVVEVHASFDASSGRYVATRVQASHQAASFKLRGVVTGLDTSARNLSIGRTRVSYAGVADGQLPALANGQVVVAVLRAAAVNGVWLAQELKLGGEAIPENAEADVDGIVSGYVDLTSFMLNGVRVNAAAWNAIFKNGTSGQITNGVHVLIKGGIRGGVLIADQVEFKSSGG